MNIHELEKILLESEKPSDFFNNTKLDDTFIELKNLVGVMQNEKYHGEGDVWTHTMMVLDEAAKKRDIVKNPLGFMLSALCHDFGKAVCTEKINGVIHSYNHETEGLPLVRAFLERISAEDDLIDYVLNMVRLHMNPNKMAKAKSKTKSMNRLFDSAVEPFDLIQLAICDDMGRIPQNSEEEFLMMRFERYNDIMSRPYVTADDLINAGITTRVDEVLEYAHKLRLAGTDKENTLRQSISYARKVLKI